MWLRLKNKKRGDNEMDSIIRFLYSFKFTVFGVTFNSENLSETIWSLTNFEEVKNNGVYLLASSINKVVVPIGLSLLTLFFMIGLIKKCQEIEKITWERIALWGATFFILVFLTKNSFTFLTTIMNVVNDLFIDVSNAVTGTGGEIQLGIADKLIASTDGMNWIDKAMSYVLFLMLAIPFIATLVQIITQVFLRVVKLMLCISFSPIPIAMAVEEETYRGKALQYIMYTAGVAFEAIIIYLACCIYTIGISQLGSTSLNAISLIIAVLFMNGVFMAIIQFSAQFSEKIFGRG